MLSILHGLTACTRFCLGTGPRAGRRRGLGSSRRDCRTTAGVEDSAAVGAGARHNQAARARGVNKQITYKFINITLTQTYLPVAIGLRLDSAFAQMKGIS